MKKSILFFGLVLLCTTPTFSQDLGIEQGAKSMWDQIKAAAPYILAAIFLASALINISKLFGENRDYVAFVRGLLLWLGGLILVSAMVSYILTLTF